MHIEYSKAVSSLAKTGSWPAAQPSAPAVSTTPSGITVSSSHGHNDWPRDVNVPLPAPSTTETTAAKTTRDIDLVPTPGPIVFGSVPQIGRRSISDFIESFSESTFILTTVSRSTFKDASGQEKTTDIPVTVVSTTLVRVPIPTNQVDPPGVTIPHKQGNAAIAAAITIGALVLIVGVLICFFFCKHRRRKVDPFLINDPEHVGETPLAVSPWAVATAYTDSYPPTIVANTTAVSAADSIVVESNAEDRYSSPAVRNSMSGTTVAGNGTESIASRDNRGSLLSSLSTATTVLCSMVGTTVAGHGTESIEQQSARSWVISDSSASSDATHERQLQFRSRTPSSAYEIPTPDGPVANFDPFSDPENPFEPPST